MSPEVRPPVRRAIDPSVKAAAVLLVRGALWVGATWLVQRGWLTQASAATYVPAVALAAVAYGWALWERHGQLVLINTALAIAGVSLRVAQGLVREGLAPPAFVPPNRVPYLEGQKPIRYSTDPIPPEETPVDRPPVPGP